MGLAFRVGDMAEEKGQYRHYSREQLIELLRRRDSELKLGLVWERDELEAERAINDDFVALSPVEELSLGHHSRNLIIEGDNFDALRALRATHKGKVKCIYIDPPYNTGNKDFAYNDSFVDKTHRYRHSLWVEFMYRRLELAVELLSDDGVIMISIGDEEHARLELLMEKLMPGRKVANFVVKVRSGANNADNNVSIDHEYVVCYANPGFSFSGVGKDGNGYSNPDGDPRGVWGNDNLLVPHDIYERPNTFYPVHNPVTDVWYPCNPSRVWGWASQQRLPKKSVDWTMESLIADKRIAFKPEPDPYVFNSEEELRQAILSGDAPADLRITLERESLQARVDAGEIKQIIVDVIPPLSFWVGKKIGRTRPRYKRFLSELRSETKPLSSLIFKTNDSTKDVAEQMNDVDRIDSGMTSEGTSLLRQILPGSNFPYPKPLELIKGLIEQATRGYDEALILDFFGGSGTTAHAVAALNAEQGTRKRFILCSNTEATEKQPNKNLCRDVLAERVRRVMQGYSFPVKGGMKEVAGIGGSFTYLRSVRIPLQDVYLELQQEQTWTALLLLHDLPVPPYVRHAAPDLYRLKGKGGNPSLVYVAGDDGYDQLQALVAGESRLIVYARRPRLVDDLLQAQVNELIVRSVPEVLLTAFWRNA